MANPVKRKTSPKRTSSVKHTHVVCPQCGKRVNVPAQLSMTQRAYPCPNCKVPISRALIEATVAEETAEATPTEATPETEATGETS